MADRMNQGGGVAERQRGQQGSAGNVLGGVTEGAQHLASNVASAAGQAWDATSGGAQQAASAVAHTAGDAWGSMRSCMSRYPLATFFAGAAVGALVVLSMRNR